MLVTGGTGVFGSRAVRILSDAGQTVVVLSRQASPPVPDGVLTARGDLETGEGVEAAVDAVDAILHAASDPRRAKGRGDVEATRNLCQAARAAGVGNLFYISIVGIDEIPLSYYRAKLACERVIESSGAPFTIFRATQFHELLSPILRRTERWPLAPLPLGFEFQTVAASDVATEACHLLGQGALGRVADFGGPQVLTLGEMVEVWRSVRAVRLRTLRIRLPGRVGRGFRSGLNTCPDRARGHVTWESHVRGLRTA